MSEAKLRVTDDDGRVRSSDGLPGREAPGPGATGPVKASAVARPVCVLDGYPCVDDDCNLRAYCDFRAHEHTGASAGAQRDASEPGNTQLSGAPEDKA